MDGRAVLNERIRVSEAEVEQIVGEIDFGPFSSPMMRAIFKQFGKEAFGRSSGCMEFEHFLIALGVRGKHCLEIGTFNGITACLLTQFFDRVTCVTVEYDDRCRKLRAEIAAFLGLKDRIAFIDVPNHVPEAKQITMLDRARLNAEKKRIVDALDFDFAYSDGDHTNDTHEDFALVKRCGRVLLHEAWVLQPSVWNLANSLPKEEVTWAQFDCLALWTRK